MSGDIFGCHNLALGATVIKWVEARDTIKYPTVRKAALNNKELAQNVNSADFEKLDSRARLPGFKSWLHHFLVV